MHHRLKTRTEYFNAVISGVKNFEIRKNDRNFQPGDTVMLCEYVEDQFTGCEISAVIGYVTTFAQQDGYVVFSLL